MLIIDKDTKTLDALAAGVAAEGYQTQIALDGQAGLEAARAGEHDLIVLDADLPRLDGFSLIESLRQAGDETPVIFLTARGSVPDRVRGLSLGADDYVTKPFDPAELLARIKSVLRRTGARSSAAGWQASEWRVLRIGDLELDLIRNRAARAGQQLKLTPKEFALLSLLARLRGQVLTRPVIARQIWDMNLDTGTNVVDVHVRRLRAKVDDPFDHKLVHTIRGEGYVLEDRDQGNEGSKSEC
jgi:two-component system copper resistance phosphate regulon response regulator CusR